MSNITLYELAADFRATADQLADLDLDPQTVADTLESIALPLEQKAERVAMFARSLEATADQIKQAESDMAKRRKAIENRAAHLREYLLANMQRAGITKIECPYFRLAVRSNPPKVVVDDERQIPADYWREPPPPAPVLDKTLLSQALKDGYSVPGARLEVGYRLEVR